MSNELAVRQSDNIQVSAQTPEEMKEANKTLVQWCNNKISQLRVDYIELEAAWKSALQKKWKHSVLQRHAEMAKKRIIFYGKIRTALMSGFYIVPNFPVQIFAIRTARTAPLKLFSTDKRCSYKPHRNKTQSAQILPEGEGTYQNPFPVVEYDKDTIEDSQTKQKSVNWSHWAETWKDLEFPLAMSKPHIMEAVDKVMALKLFDEFGVIPGSSMAREHSGGDPMIIARIKDPRSTYSNRYISFIVTWHLDTRTL